MESTEGTSGRGSYPSLAQFPDVTPVPFEEVVPLGKMNPNEGHF